MKKRKVLLIAVIALVLIAIAAVLGTVLFVHDYSTNYVLKINDEKISSEEFQKYLKWQMDYMQESSEEEIDWAAIEEESGVPYFDLAKDLTVDLITETTVQLQEAEKRGIELTEEEKEYVASYVKYYLGQSDALSQYDLTTEEWIEIYQDYQIINKLSLEICNEKLTPYDARHILITTAEAKNEDEKMAIKNKAQGILDKVLAGEDFAKLAKENSEDPGSVENGGLYQGVAKGAFVEEFEKAALSLNDGEIYPELVESMHGYHIIKLEKKISDTPITTLGNNEYYQFMMIVQEWVENAEVNKGQQFMLIGY